MIAAVHPITALGHVGEGNILPLKTGKKQEYSSADFADDTD
jgi:hypothetical protein